MNGSICCENVRVCDGEDRLQRSTDGRHADTDAYAETANLPPEESANQASCASSRGEVAVNGKLRGAEGQTAEDSPYAMAAHGRRVIC